MLKWFKKKMIKPIELPQGEHNFSAFVGHPKWRWKNFQPKELASKSDGLLMINEDALDKLQSFRELLGKPFTPNSAYRSLAHNTKVGGSPNSMHLQGRAFDIPIGNGITRKDIHKYAKQVGFTGFGDYKTFVHIDTGRPRYWDNR